VSIYCYSGSAQLQAAFYDTPTIPTSFSGRSSSSGTSTVAFNVPYAGQYVADVTLDQGAITFDGETLAPSGRIDLGSLAKGSQTRDVNHPEGPPTAWTIRIVALPVVLSAAKVDAVYARTGDIVKLSYTVSGDTHVSAVVTNAAGVPVRILATSLVEALKGDHSLTWDARGVAGQPLGDGVYTLGSQLLGCAAKRQLWLDPHHGGQQRADRDAHYPR
jgi:hypothetical protein